MLGLPADDLVTQFYSIALAGCIESWLIGELPYTPEELIQFADTMLQDHLQGAVLRRDAGTAKA